MFLFKLGVLDIGILKCINYRDSIASTARACCPRSIYYYTLHEVDGEGDGSTADEAAGNPVLTSAIAGNVGRLGDSSLFILSAMSFPMHWGHVRC